MNNAELKQKARAQLGGKIFGTGWLYAVLVMLLQSAVVGIGNRGRGVGLAVLWRTNPSWKQNLFITGLTWGAGALLGVAMQVVVAVFA